MSKQLTLKQGVVVPAPNRPNFPKLHIQKSNSQSKDLIRIYELIKNGRPKILIRRGEGIGDVLMVTPIFRFLASQFPGAELTCATNLSYLGGALPAVLEGNPYIDRVVSWNHYNEKDYDIVLNLHCPCVAHEKKGAPPISRQDLFARHIGIPYLDNPKPILNLTKEEINWAKEYVHKKIRARVGDSIVLINPFASTEYRSFPLQEIKLACSHFLKHRNIKVVILTHNDSDFIRGENWQQCCHYIARDLPVRKFAALTSIVDLLICPDSAGLHIAGALDTPALGIFGPTDPRARVNHYKTVVALWPGYNLGCYCWFESHKCSHQNCWRKIKSKDIYETGLGVMNGTVTNAYYEEREVTISTNNSVSIEGELV